MWIPFTLTFMALLPDGPSWLVRRPEPERRTLAEPLEVAAALRGATRIPGRQVIGVEHVVARFRAEPACFSTGRGVTVGARHAIEAKDEEGQPVPTALFTVKATITPDREKAFNEWYNHEHVQDVFKFKGVVSARRYKAIMPEDKFQYIAVYEFENEEALQRFLKSDHLAWLRKEP
jgi:Domain of unknown function (DUF4286)